MENIRPIGDLRVLDISVISVSRPFGRTAKIADTGRALNGFLYVRTGEVTFFCEEKPPIVVQEGNLAYLPQKMKYELKYTAPSTSQVVVNFRLLDNNDEVSLFDEITLLNQVEKTSRIADTIAAFERCSTEKTVVADLRKKELFYRLLGAVYATSAYCATDFSDDRIAQGVRLLEQSYLENLPIQKFADASFISINMFRNLFHKQFGMSPVKYRNYLRIERSKELLREGDFTVAEVAYACGFETVGYFCRCYQKITGETPSQIRKQPK